MERRERIASMTNDWATYQDWRKAFASVMDSRHYSIEWLDREVDSGRMKFFATDGAALVTEMRNYPTGRFDLHFMVAAGDLEVIRDVLRPEAERWARRMGAGGAIVESREGWQRTLLACGYEPFQICLRKDL